MASLSRFVTDNAKKALSVTGAYDWRHRGGVTILMYHRVLPAALLKLPAAQASLAVSTQAFERNLRLLRKRYTLLSFKAYLNHVENGDWSRDKRYAIVTLDDGCADNYYHAFPILAKYEIPATIFVVISHVGTDLGFWWQVIGDAIVEAYCRRDGGHAFFEVARAHGVHEDRTLREVFRARRIGEAARRVDAFIAQLKSLAPGSVLRFADDCAAIMRKPVATTALNWEQIAEMSARGIEFGSHAVRHCLLTKLPIDDAVKEIAGSAAALQARPDINYAPVFSYPNGDVNNAVSTLAREAGYRAAVTTHSRVAGFNPIDPYRLPRINIAGHVAASNLLFKLKLSRAGAERALSTAVDNLAQA